MPTRKARGRRKAVKVPCDDCIVKASQSSDNTANIELCSSCTSVLHRPRRRPEEASGRQARAQSSASSLSSSIAVGRGRTKSAPAPFNNNGHEQHASQEITRHNAPQLAGHDEAPPWKTPTRSKGWTGQEHNVASDVEAIRAREPSNFSSLYDAQSGLELVLNHLMISFLNLELEDNSYDLLVSHTEKHMLFRPWLQSWERAFSAFLAHRQTTISAQDRKRAIILKAYHLVAEILSNVNLSLGELGWDLFHTRFTAIVDLAAAVLEDSTTGATFAIDARRKDNELSFPSQAAPSSFSLNIIDPVYEVCTRCKDPVLRRRALRLLAPHLRQEGMWSPSTTLKTGRLLTLLEEEGLGMLPG